MEKNTILAIALSVVVLIGFSVWQGIAGQKRAANAPPPVPAQPAPSPQPMQSPPETMPPAAPMPSAPDAAAGMAALDGGPETEEEVKIETDLFTVILTNAGGDIVSFKLNEHDDKDDLVEMVLSGDREARAFAIAFGGLNTPPVTSLFHVEKESNYSVKFYRDFSIPNPYSPMEAQFRLTKKYEFNPGDYMFKLTVTLDGGYSTPGFNFGGSAYTLSFGPQIGPRFEKLDNRYDYRHYITFTNGKRKTEKPNDLAVISTNPKWAAICGKYFACIAVPLLAQYDINFSDRPEAGLPAASRLNIIRPPLNSPRADDVYYFYLGPKNQETLNRYNTGNNSFGLMDMQLIEVSNTRGILNPLEKALKWLLLIFYRMIPNYGIAIILLTLTIKIVFFPLTKKGSEATLRMQALSPKIKEIQTKYKDNPQKMNAEMGELYKKEGYNPLSGCLPMLLQFPIFFAMYNLFNNHFDLRGAMFIPGWIPDLSQPEFIVQFPPGFSIPFVGWTALRLLPFIYVGSQLLYGKVTQTPDQQSNTQMKMMLYVMPIVFFFILYDVPSGLLVYWIFSNLLTLVQQVVINKYIIPRKKAQQEASAPAVIAPQKKKKK
ncbi:MAG: membrane protein insertase YidC [Treponema sp.]|nr:membrane protein insertase YidC [Treponema sp.]